MYNLEFRILNEPYLQVTEKNRGFISDFISDSRTSLRHLPIEWTWLLLVEKKTATCNRFKFFNDVSFSNTKSPKRQIKTILYSSSSNLFKPHLTIHMFHSLIL